ncbi:MAG: threonylcarbamoyl-AMP synthase [Chlamydiales bacterium]|nr:threonylcarbamoyl-AMP synthase [Chlamydiales bacterium]
MLVTIHEIKSFFEKGVPVACPTETVYGLAAPISKPLAIKKIFSIKQRPHDNPLILHCKSLQQVKEYVSHFPEEALLLAKEFWPGPLTMVLPAKIAKLPSLIRANLDTIACRVPNHPSMLELIEQFGPIVAPSCNLSGKPSATCYEHVVEDFSSSFPVYGKGTCQKGIESTILIYKAGKFHLGRQGAYPTEVIENKLSYSLNPLQSKAEAPLCPGQKYRHYAPHCKLLIDNLTYQGQSTCVLGNSREVYQGADQVVTIGDYSNPEELAHNLYAALRKLDQLGVVEAWVDTNFSKTGPFAAFFERLKKAATSS